MRVLKVTVSGRVPNLSISSNHASARLSLPAFAQVSMTVPKDMSPGSTPSSIILFSHASAPLVSRAQPHALIMVLYVMGLGSTPPASIRSNHRAARSGSAALAQASMTELKVTALGCRPTRIMRRNTQHAPSGLRDLAQLWMRAWWNILSHRPLGPSLEAASMSCSADSALPPTSSSDAALTRLALWNLLIPWRLQPRPRSGCGRAC
mmetsp:Transcript_77005/g.218251  ORF Transcript_77005/g.218251 Transcript_77005/m.218251 type:complete len:207 (-) Transcript_77005:53-673(-)